LVVAVVGVGVGVGATVELVLEVLVGFGGPAVSL
jgi:hypothetical protein